jgi:hypothetical protein
MVVGDGREDEKVFKWANSLNEDGTVKEVVTVSLGARNTEAKATLTQGVSGMIPPLLVAICHTMLTIQRRPLNTAEACPDRVSIPTLPCSLCQRMNETGRPYRSGIRIAAGVLTHHPSWRRSLVSFMFFLISYSSFSSYVGLSMSTTFRRYTLDTALSRPPVAFCRPFLL